MKTILLLDDDKDFRALVAPALSAKGHEIVQARTGAEGLAAVAAQPLDLAVVDGLLPDTDGVSFIARLRETRPDLPVIFVSAFWRDLASFNRLTRDLRVALVLHKPIAPALFVEEVETLLAGRKLAAPRLEVAPNAEKALRALAAEYGRSLPAKRAELAEAVRRFRTAPRDAALGAAARSLAHRLRGTAGSYGYREVGEAAGRVEDSLRALEGSEPPADAWSRFDGALAEFLNAVDAVEISPPEEEGAQAAISSGKLLAVSASPDLLDKVRTLGRQQLYQTICVGSAAEAIAAAVSNPPDAAFLDLPVPQAARLARDLRGQAACEAMSIAFISEAGGTPDRIAAAHAGASLFLTKPIDAEGLSAAARQMVASALAHRPRILMVDDDEDFARQVSAMLERKGFSVRYLAEPARILDTLDEAPPDLVLLDVVMPGLSGLDICRMVRATPRWQDLPIVMLTAQPGIQARIGAFQSGADDYLSKPVVEEELLARVQVRVERARLLRERYDKDALTGLLLRRPLVEGLRARLLEASRHLRPLALAIIDFDGFKGVNDTHGHLAGDAVLAAFGKLVARRFRAEDLRGRWGGEEFLLTFPGETTDTIKGALERLEAEFAQIDFRGDKDEPFRVTFCVGIAGFPDDGRTLEQLIRAADRRLYAAKHAGDGLVFATG